MVRRILAAATAVVLLSSCRVDVSTSVEVHADGSGTIVVEAVADAELVDAAPGLADDLRVDDLEAAGWTVEGPTDTADGGLRMVLRHDFAGPDEATELLGQLNGPRGPYRDVVVARTVADDSVTLTVTGELGVNGGLRALADDALIESVGGVPWADVLASRDEQLADVLGAELVVALPDENGNATSVTVDADGATGVEVVTMPADGSAIPVDLRTLIDLTPDQRSPLVATVAGIALIVWLAVSISFAVYVIRARRRRQMAGLRNLAP